MLLPPAADGLLHWPVMGAVMLVSIIERFRAPDVARWGTALPHLSRAAPRA
jgi:hypothetical protein